MDLHRRPGGLLIGHGLAKKSQTSQNATPCGFKRTAQFERVCAEYGSPFNCASTRESGPRSDVRKADSVRGPLLALLSLRITTITPPESPAVKRDQWVPTNRCPPVLIAPPLPGFPRACVEQDYFRGDAVLLDLE